MDAALLPDLGDPISLPDVMPSEQWSVLDSCIDDWTVAKPDGPPRAAYDLVSPDAQLLMNVFPPDFMSTFVELEAELGNSLFDEVHVVRSENGVQIRSPVEHARPGSGSAPLKWAVSLQWDEAARALVTWRWESPYRYINERQRRQARLRLLVTDNVAQRMQYSVFHAGRPVDEYGNEIDDIVEPLKCIDYDPVRVEFQIVDEQLRHPEARFAPDEKFRPKVPHRFFDRWEEQLGHDMRIAVYRDPTLVFLPFLIFAGAVPIAAALATALALGSVYFALANRATVARLGYDAAGQSHSEEELDIDLRLAVIFLLMPTLGPRSRVAVRVAEQLQRAARTQLVITTAFTAAPRPLRMLVGMADRRAAEAVLNATAKRVLIPDEVLLAGKMSRVEKINMAAREFHEGLIVRTITAPRLPGVLSPRYLLNEIAMDSIFTPGGTGFKIFALQSLYTQYVARIRATFEIPAGISLERALGRLAPDPISWLLRGGGPASRKARQMRELLGQDWQQKIRDFRDIVPLPQDVLDIADKFPKGTISYRAAQSLRDQLVPERLKRIAINPDIQHHIDYPRLWELVRAANRKSFGAMFELEHPFERRCVKAFAGPHDPDALEVLNYIEEAKVILVPRIRRVSQHIPGFSGYVHWEKSRMMESLIAYGMEQKGKYSLQEMRDAHVFVISALEGHDSQAIKMIDEAVAIISRRTQSPVEFTSSRSPAFRAQFRVGGTWRYHPPSEEMAVAMSYEQYLRQRFLIDEALAREETGSRLLKGRSAVDSDLVESAGREPVPAGTDPGEH